jgi:hypothetical protein
VLAALLKFSVAMWPPWLVWSATLTAQLLFEIHYPDC